MRVDEFGSPRGLAVDGACAVDALPPDEQAFWVLVLGILRYRVVH